MIPLPQHDNYLLSSMLVWADHTILKHTRAFSNQNTLFHNIVSPFGNSVQCFASPFNQFIYDNSISGANIGTGVYINGVYSTTGQNGLLQIDYQNGRVYTTGLTNPIISGEFGVKYFNVKLTDEPDETILTTTAYNLRPKTFNESRGLQVNETNYPVIFFRNNGGYNEPLTFGGLEETVNNVRAIVLSDTEYSLGVINSMFRDRSKTLIPILNSTQQPFNMYGGLKTGAFNYDEIYDQVVNSQNYAFLHNVYITKYNQNYIEIRGLDQKIFCAVIDFELGTHRYPRNT